MAKKLDPDQLATIRISNLLQFGAFKYKLVKNKKIKHRKKRFIETYQDAIKKILYDGMSEPDKQAMLLASEKKLHKEGRKKFWFYRKTIFGKGSDIRRIYKKLTPELNQRDKKDFYYTLAKAELFLQRDNFFSAFKNIQRAIDSTNDKFQQQFAIHLGIQWANTLLTNITGKTHHHLCQFESAYPAYLFIKAHIDEQADSENKFLTTCYEELYQAISIADDIMSEVKLTLLSDITCQENYCPSLSNTTRKIKNLLNIENQEHGFYHQLTAFLKASDIQLPKKFDTHLILNFLIYNIHELAFFTVTELKKDNRWAHMREHNEEARRNTAYFEKLAKCDGKDINLRTNAMQLERQYSGEITYERRFALADHHINKIKKLTYSQQDDKAIDALVIAMDPHCTHRHVIKEIQDKLKIDDDNLLSAMDKIDQSIQKDRDIMKKIADKVKKCKNFIKRNYYLKRLIHPLYQKPFNIELSHQQFDLNRHTKFDEKQVNLQRAILKL